MRQTWMAAGLAVAMMTGPAAADCRNQQMSGSTAVGLWTYQWDDFLDGPLAATNPIGGDFPFFDSCTSGNFEVGDIIRIVGQTDIAMVTVTSVAPLRLTEFGRAFRD